MKFTGILKFSLLIHCLILVGCKQYKDIQPPTVERITNFTPGALKDGQLTFSFATQLHNPGLLKFKIKSARLDILFNGIKIGELKSFRSIRVKKEIRPEVTWQVTANLEDLIKNPKSILGALFKGKINFETTGTITISKCFYRKTLPVSLKTPIQIPM